MRLYQTSRARQSAISNIRKLIDKINAVSGDQLDYFSGRQTVQHLNDLIRVIEEEEKNGNKA